jgi:hypothetical protein
MLENRIMIETAWCKRRNLSLFESGFFDEFGYNFINAWILPDAGIVPEIFPPLFRPLSKT